MTRKDYIVIADAIASARRRVSEPIALDAIEIATEELAEALLADNPRFDPQRFTDYIKRQV